MELGHLQYIIIFGVTSLYVYPAGNPLKYLKIMIFSFMSCHHIKSPNYIINTKNAFNLKLMKKIGSYITLRQDALKPFH